VEDAVGFRENDSLVRLPPFGRFGSFGQSFGLA